MSDLAIAKKELLKLVNEQEADKKLWHNVDATPTQGQYLQYNLRLLHALIKKVFDE